MKDLLKKFEEKPPEVVFEWHDSETEAKGWVVINSLRGGAAGGGTRMRIGVDKREVESLAKTMEVKFTVSGPAIGGAKSGINFDPRDPRKEGVLKRWYRAVYPLLKNYYGTGGDMNVDEIEEVIPITEEYGLWHPQEGIVNGHFDPPKPQKIHMIGRLRQGVSKVLEDWDYVPTPSPKKFTVADMITGFGVAESIRHYYDLWGGEVGSKRAIIQGWGNVGATAALYLAKYGVKIVGIIDKEGGIIDRDGIDLDGVKKLFHDRDGNKLVSDRMIPFDQCNAEIWDVPAEIFVPAAASRLVTDDQAKRMVAQSMEVMSCGANVPFKDEEIFFGPIAEYVDNNISLLPDFISNCGMARVFAYLMGQTSNSKITDDAIFKDVSNVIRESLEAAHNESGNKTRIAQTAFAIALRQLV